ncbi:WD40 repeat domain-containing protein [Caballeronia sp. LjRoot34]|uniref:WD40 repeat domain-containing protein n=1 Tax=Caballeronia sp. LjRoot34 TaxID=3342325 RepID=UPI003ECDA34A
MLETEFFVDSVRTVESSDAIVAATFFRGDAVFTRASGGAECIGQRGDQWQLNCGPGAILCITADDSRLVAGCDNGLLVSSSDLRTSDVIGKDARRRWIERVALGSSSLVAWSAGKDVTVRSEAGSEASFQVDSAGGGMAFLGQNARLAVAHSGGITLWSPDRPPETLEKPGVHTELLASADGRFLVSAMQESVVNGWHLADKKSIRFAGYSERVRSMDWTCDGRWLATSGAERLMLWPLQVDQSIRGPTMPLLWAPYSERVTIVACNPVLEIVATGYADGLLLLVRVRDGAEIVLATPRGSSVCSLAWDRDGVRLAVVTSDGKAQLLFFR